MHYNGHALRAGDVRAQDSLADQAVLLCQKALFKNSHLFLQPSRRRSGCLLVLRAELQAQHQQGPGNTAAGFRMAHAAAESGPHAQGLRPADSQAGRKACAYLLRTDDPAAEVSQNCVGIHVSSLLLC